MERESFLNADYLASERAINERFELSQARLDAYMAQIPERMNNALRVEAVSPAYTRPNPRPQPVESTEQDTHIEHKLIVPRSVGIIVGGATVVSSFMMPLPSADARDERVVSQTQTSVTVEIPQNGTLSGAQLLIPVSVRPSVHQMAEQIGEKKPDVIQPGVYEFKHDAKELPDGYVVRSGDTLSGVARAHNTTVDVLKTRYGIENVDQLRIGQVLQVLAQEHEVTGGDTLSSIANSYGDDVKKLAAINNIADPNKIMVGQKIQLTGQPQAKQSVIKSPEPAAAEPTIVPTPQSTATDNVKNEAPQVLAKVEVKQPAEVVKPSASLALDSIQNLYGADADTIKNVVRHLVDAHGFSPKGAAYMAGSGLRESWLKTDVVGDNGQAKGLFQMAAERADDMPQDFYGQIDHAVQNMRVDAISVKKLVLQTLRDPNASDKDVELAIRWFERYDQRDQNNDGKADGEGDRFAYGAQIYHWITTPRVAESATQVTLPTPAPSNEKVTVPSIPLQPAPQIIEADKTPTTTEVMKANEPVLKPQMLEQQAKAKTIEDYKAILNSKFIENASVTIEDNGVMTVKVKGEKVNVEIAQRFADMLLAAEEAELDLIVLDGFRSTADQVEMRKINGCPDIWKSPAESCKIPTARPGSSNHQDGNAVDFRYRENGEELKIEDHNNPAFQWLKQNAKKYGFYNLPSEPWHWSTNGR